MARVGHQGIDLSSLPEYAAVLERGRLAQKQPWTEQRRRMQSKVALRVNKQENSKHQNFVCYNCNQEFKQITKSEFAGHRRYCLNYANKSVPNRPFVLPTIETSKQCGKCGQFKPLSEFNKARKARLGVASWCRKCAKQHRKSGEIIGSNNLHDYVCSDCGQEFKQVKPGVFGGHRGACVNYRKRKLEFLEWNGSEQEFASKHELPLATVYRWSRL